MSQITLGKRTFVIPEKGAPCDLWRAYYEQLEKAVGSSNARVIWLVTWKENGSASCTTNAGFNRWLKRQRIDVSSAATRTVADLGSIGGNIMGLGKNLSGIISIGVPVLLGGVVLVVLILLVNTSRKMDVGDAAALIPASRAAKLAGGFKMLNP